MNHPPKWADRFLHWYCHPDLLEEIQGDAQELFFRRAEEEGLQKAKRKYVWDVLRFFRWSNLNKSKKLKVNSLIMFNSYLKIGFRNISKNWGISFINIFGLSLAVGCAITFFIFLDAQYNMDSYHSKKDDIYSLVSHVTNEGGTEIWAQNPLLLAPDLQTNQSIVENTMRMEYERGNMRHGDKVFSELISYTDPSFLEMFDYELSQGNREVLSQKQNMVISSAMAEKYFGDSDPMGETMSIKFPGERSQSFVVAGVMEKFKANASFSFDIIVPMENYFDLQEDETLDYSYLTNVVFVQLEKGSHPSQLIEQMDKYVSQHNKKSSDWTIESFEFIPLTEMALRDYEVNGGISSGGHPAGRISMAVIGITLLLLACFNYMNISVSSATKRLKEIALRKVMGGARKQIIHQFLTENLILCMFSMVLGTLLCYYFFLPGFNMMLPIIIPFTFSSAKVAIIFFGGLLLLIGFASGSYPAFYISKFQPVSIFRGGPVSGKGLFSKVLLSLQLILACMTLVACIIFSDNAIHMSEKDWGYDPSGIFAVRINNDTQYASMVQAAESNPGVKSYAGSRGHIGKYDMITTASHLDKQIKTYYYKCAPSYLETMNLRLVEGKLLDQELSNTDSKWTVITTVFAEKMGWDSPIDQTFTVDSTDYQVVGMVERFYTRNFHGEESAAFFITGEQENFNFFILNVEQEAMFDIDEQVHEAWFQATPNDPYDRTFQMFAFDGFYQENNANIYILLSISVFAIILGCLGLFGLLSFNLQRRMKEFGVRKVLGAGSSSIIILANKEYLWVMLASLLVGVPVGFYLMNTLLPIIYAEPKQITATPFIISIGIMVFTIGVTVTGQIWRATKTNPADVLRSE